MIGGRLKIVNESSYPTAEVEALVRFGLSEIDVKGRKILALVCDNRTRDYRGWGGWADQFESHRIRKLAREQKANFVVQMLIGKPGKFPITPFIRNGILHDYMTWQEALVGITAHEGLHVQHRHDGAYTEKNATRAIKGTKRRRSYRTGVARIEPKCAAFENYMLRKYRADPTRSDASLDEWKEQRKAAIL